MNIQEINSRFLRNDDPELEMESLTLSPMDSWQPVPIEFEDDEQTDKFEFPPPEFTESLKVKENEQTPKGSFMLGKFQGYGNTDYLDETYRPEWRTGYSVRDRYYNRINNPNMLEVHQSYWSYDAREGCGIKILNLTSY